MNKDRYTYCDPEDENPSDREERRMEEGDYWRDQLRDAAAEKEWEEKHRAAVDLH